MLSSNTNYSKVRNCKESVSKRPHVMTKKIDLNISPVKGCESFRLLSGLNNSIEAVLDIPKTPVYPANNTYSKTMGRNKKSFLNPKKPFKAKRSSMAEGEKNTKNGFQIDSDPIMFASYDKTMCKTKSSYLQSTISSNIRASVIQHETTKETQVIGQNSQSTSNLQSVGTGDGKPLIETDKFLFRSHSRLDSKQKVRLILTIFRKLIDRKRPTTKIRIRIGIGIARSTSIQRSLMGF